MHPRRLVGPEPPHRVARMLIAFERYGLLAGAVTIGAIRNGDRVAMRDERGDVTYRELDLRSNALANAWRERGLKAGDGVAILARNHRGFLDALFAAAKCGARIILLNTSFAGPQIREVAGREGTDLLVYDDEYAEILEGVEPPLGRWRAWVDDDETNDEDTIDALILASKTSPRPSQVGPKIVILTSGTTGTPKGAPRSEPKVLSLIGGLLGKVPFRARETTELCAPMFHALGFAMMALGLGLGSTLVVRRKFDPEATLRSLGENQASTMVVVPVMLQRILDLGEDTVKAADTSSLRIIFVSGSALGTELVKRALHAFGDGLQPLRLDRDRLRDDRHPDRPQARAEHGRRCRARIDRQDPGRGRRRGRAGEVGRIFVGNAAQFEGYTGGGNKELVDG